MLGRAVATYQDLSSHGRSKKIDILIAPDMNPTHGWCYMCIYYLTPINFPLRYSLNTHWINEWLRFLRAILQAEKLKLIKVTCLCDGVAVQFWAPSPCNITSSHSALWGWPYSPIPRTGGLENSRHLLYLRKWIFLVPWKWKALKQFRTTGSFLQEGRSWELPSLFFAGVMGPPGPPKIREPVGGGRLDSQLCRWGLLSSASFEDCLTTKEWFELARDGKIHCREHWGCL